MTNLVLLSYGSKPEYLRAACAVLSFWAWYEGPPEDVRTVVFTDEPTGLQPYLAGLPIAYEVLTANELVAMKGPQQFNHRVKVAIIDRVFQKYPTASVLYIDSDTFFQAKPTPLLAGVAAATYMHQREYTLAEALPIYTEFDQVHYPQALIELIENQKFKLGEATVQFHRQQYTWNSGVLGLPPHTAGLFPDLYTLTDAFYAGSSWFTSEQVAFSFALQNQAQLQACQRYVYHYWGREQKALMDSILLGLFNASFAELPLATRLAKVHQQVPQWRRQLARAKTRQGAIYALETGQLSAGLKCTVKALFSAPLDVKLLKGLYHFLHSKALRRMSQLRANP